MKSVAVIGAGISGLAAGQRLRRAGLDVAVFEKGRGLGGRMATRRVGELQFDHGAQYFTAKGPRFRSIVEEWATVGIAALWFDETFVGTPSMTAPARRMVEGLRVSLACEISRISRDDMGWSVHDADGPIDVTANGRFASLLLAVPAPQAIPLVASAGIDLPGLQNARFAPCWALMLSYDRPLNLTSSHIKPGHDSIAWIADNSGKPGRSRDVATLVVHATAAWSRKNLDLSPEQAARELIGFVRDVTGLSIEPSFMAAHRWRYALVEEDAGSAFLWDEGERLGACGDWCLGPRVEAAFDSGEALAAAVIATLGVQDGS